MNFRFACAAGALTVASLNAAQPMASGAREAVPKMFTGSNQCLACHNNLETVAGEDVSIAADWRASMMAHSSVDPYWQGAVRREVSDHPAAASAIEDECAKCHMPMARYRAHAFGGRGTVFVHLPVRHEPPGLDQEAPATLGQLAAEGVSCPVCHQIEPTGLGEEESFTGGFVIDPATPAGGRQVFGPYTVDAGRTTTMQSASTFRPSRGTHLQEAELCATCHTLYTHTLGPGGEVVGELPEQVPYLEWRHSDYATRRSCQSCHLPTVEDPTAISAVFPQPREGFSKHRFRGGNFFLLELLQEERETLGTRAPEAELADAIETTRDHLQEEAATVEIVRSELAGGTLAVDVAVRNRAGHKLPTAYPSRRAWVRLVVTDADDQTVFSSGALRPDGSIAGNDNDEDALRYEPHHSVIRDAAAVQIYEAIMVTPEGTVTTGLLSAERFIKDNRLLPAGFEVDTAPPDIAVRGAAAEDPEFDADGDVVSYRLPEPDGRAPFTVEATLIYQPISFRWARNLADYPAAETQRFAALYAGRSDRSAIELAKDAAEVP